MTRKDIIDIFSPYMTMGAIANLYGISVNTVYDYGSKKKPISQKQIYKILAGLNVHTEQVRIIEEKLTKLTKLQKVKK